MADVYWKDMPGLEVRVIRLWRHGPVLLLTRAKSSDAWHVYLRLGL